MDANMSVDQERSDRGSQLGQTMQLGLPLSREERLALAAQFQQYGPAGMPRLWRKNGHRLLREIELSSGSAGCRNSEVLASKLDITARNLSRWMDYFAALGIVACVPDRVTGENVYHVNWDCVRRYGKAGLASWPAHGIGQS